MRSCQHCTLWKENINKLLFPLVFLARTNPSLYTGYIGDLFRFCPWCGNVLSDDGDSVEHPEKVQVINSRRRI